MWMCGEIGLDLVVVAVWNYVDLGLDALWICGGLRPRDWAQFVFGSEISRHWVWLLCWLILGDLGLGLFVGDFRGPIIYDMLVLYRPDDDD